MDPPPRPPANRFRIRVAVFEPEQAQDLDAPPKHSMLIARSETFPLQDLPLRELCDEAIRRYKLIYPTESLFEIKKSQDSYGCDLLLDDRVGDIFADNEVFRIVKGTSVRSSLPPEYVRSRSVSVQPGFSSYAKRSHTASNVGDISRATKRQRVSELDPDEPLRSLERDSVDLDDRTVQGPSSSSTVIPDSQEGVGRNGTTPKVNGVSQRQTSKSKTSPDLGAPYVTPQSKPAILPPRPTFAPFPRNPTYHIERTTQNGHSVSTGITTPASPDKDEVTATASARPERYTVNGKDLNGRKRSHSSSRDIYDDIETDPGSPKRRTPRRPVTALNSALKNNPQKSAVKANEHLAITPSSKLRTPGNKSLSPATSNASVGSPDMSKKIASMELTQKHDASGSKSADSQMPDRDLDAKKGQIRRAAAEAAEKRRQVDEADKRRILEAEKTKREEEEMQKEEEIAAAEKARADAESKLQAKRAAEAQAEKEAAAQAKTEADAKAKRELEAKRIAFEKAKDEKEGDLRRKEAADLKAKRAAQKQAEKEEAAKEKAEKLKKTDKLSKSKETAELAMAEDTSSSAKTSNAGGGTILPGAKSRSDRAPTPSAARSQSTTIVPSRVSLESKGFHPNETITPSKDMRETNVKPPSNIRRSVSFSEPVASVGLREEKVKSSSPTRTTASGILKQTRIVPPPPRLSKVSPLNLLNGTPSRPGNTSIELPSSTLKIQTTLVPHPAAVQPYQIKSKQGLVARTNEEDVSTSEEESGSEEDSDSEEGSSSEEEEDQESDVDSNPEIHSSPPQLPSKSKPSGVTTREGVTNPKIGSPKSSRSSSIESSKSDERESHSPIRYSHVKPLHLPKPSAQLVDKSESPSASPSHSSSSSDGESTEIPKFITSPTRRRQTSSTSSSNTSTSSQNASQSQIDAQLTQPSPPPILTPLRSSQPSLRRMTQNLQASKEASLRTATAKTIAKQQALHDLAAARIVGEEEEEEDETSSSDDDDDDDEAGDGPELGANRALGKTGPAAPKSPLSGSEPGSAKKAHKKPDWGKLGMMFSLKKS